MRSVVQKGRQHGVPARTFKRPFGVPEASGSRPPAENPPRAHGLKAGLATPMAEAAGSCYGNVVS
jgi:hypothetical protein